MTENSMFGMIINELLTAGHSMCLQSVGIYILV